MQVQDASGDATEGPTPLSPMQDYARQLMQPEWMIEVPEDLHENW